MPLLDHWQPQIAKQCHWEGFHSLWAGTIVADLNHGTLPNRFHAEPSVRLGGNLEIDVGTKEKDPFGNGLPESGNGIATAVWSPPIPALDVQADFADQDIFEVRLVDDNTGRLVAAIELVSPANKDRPENRRAFAVKCGSYLAANVSLVVVDVVTERRASLHTELFALLQVAAEPRWHSESGLCVASYRIVARNPGITKRSRLQGWFTPLELHRHLPTVPLWLTEDLAVPLDLEKSYVAACNAVRISP